MVTVDKIRMKKCIYNHTRFMSLHEQIQMVFLYKALLTGWNIKSINNNKFELTYENKKKVKNSIYIIKPSSLDIEEFVNSGLFFNFKKHNIENILKKDMCLWKDIGKIL